MNESETVFSVPKIKCQGCASTIRQAVGPLVQSVDVDIDAKTVRVEFSPGGAGAEDVRKVLEQAGFPPR